MMNEPQVSFITVCYNGFKDTCEFIESLQTHVHSVSYEIIVVDNASREDEAAKIKELYSDIITLRSESNLGFSGGNNLGIRVAKGAYIFLINNDTYVESDGFHYLTERLESQKNIGAVSPKIRMVKREVIEKVGEMPEIFFLYYEEMDWCTQMTNAGYELWYEPRCTVFHKESQSTGQFSKLRTFYMTRNRLLYTRRNRKGAQRLLSILYQSTIAAGKNSLQFAVKGRFDLFAAVWKGVVRSFSVTSPIR